MKKSIAAGFLVIIIFFLGDSLNAEFTPRDGKEIEDDQGTSFEKFEQDFAIEQKEKLSGGKRKFARSFGIFRSDFSRMCTYMEHDGQKEWLLDYSKNYVKKRTSCPECRNLYMTLVTACSGKKIKATPTPKKRAVKNDDEENAETEGEPTPLPTATPIRIAINPSTALLDLVSNIFRSAAESKPRETAEEYLVGVKDLLTAMRNSDGKTKEAQYYYDTLAEYIEAPFKARGFCREIVTPGSVSDKPAATPAVSLDDLF